MQVDSGSSHRYLPLDAGGFRSSHRYLPLDAGGFRSSHRYLPLDAGVDSEVHIGTYH